VQDVPEDALEGRRCVVVDVLRATSTICRALAAGAKEVRIFGEVEHLLLDARECAGPLVLGGERDSRRVPGFGLGNDPREYVPESVAGASVLFTTTNGTRALLAAGGARETMVCSLLNLSAVARACTEDGADLSVVCAGSDGQYSAEDALCAGMLLERLEVARASDGARLALALAARVGEDIRPFLLSTDHGRELVRKDLKGSVEACALVDSVGLLVRYLPGEKRAVKVED